MNKNCSVVVATLVSVTIITGLVWLLLKPVVTEPLIRGMEMTVTTQLIPMTSAFVILMNGDLQTLNQEVYEFEVRRNKYPSQWTTTDMEDLNDHLLRLENLKQARLALIEAQILLEET